MLLAVFFFFLFSPYMIAIVIIRIITTGMAMRTARVAEGEPNIISQLSDVVTSDVVGVVPAKNTSLIMNETG